MLHLRCLASAVAFAAFALPAASQGPEPATSRPPVQVYILAGQSNMEGHGQLRSLPRLGEDPEHPERRVLLDKLRADDGSWAVRDDVRIVWRGKVPDAGPLGVGWGASKDEVGPELMFGTLMGERHAAPVLLIKVAWGGKDVFCDFRSPSAGAPSGDAAKLLAAEREREPDRPGREVGRSYRALVADVRASLADLPQLVPGYLGEGYELRGVAWFQGWNDYCRWHEGFGVIDDYPQHLAALIRDLRKDLDAPGLPFAIGELGIGGTAMVERAKDAGDREAHSIMAFRAAQRAVAEDLGLEGVRFVPTAAFWDDRLEELRSQSDAYQHQQRQLPADERDHTPLPTPELTAEFEALGGHWYCHYNGSAANYCLVGQALAEALAP